MRQRLIALFGAILIAFTASACTAVSSPASNADGSASDGTSGAANNNPPATTPTQLVSPIEEFTNLVTGTHLDPEIQIQLERQFRVDSENYLATCMAEAGFQYIPDPDRFTITFEATAWRPNDPEWLAFWGFGGVRNPGPREGGLHTIQGSMPGDSQPDDSNAEITEQLSPAELAAYWETLWGPSNPFSFEDEPELWEEWNSDFQQRGCFGRSFQYAVTLQPGGLRLNDEFAPLFESIEQFRTNLSLDATEADQDWAICMNDAGYPGWNRRPDFQTYFANENWELSLEITERSDWEFHRFPLWPEDAPEVAALMEREIDTALADLDCRIATNYDARQQATIFELETQFVNDNRAAFEALRAAAEQLSPN